jgi:hypothetical protein
MGRSVSQPSNTVAVCYRDVSNHGKQDYCHECDRELNSLDICDECERDYSIEFDEFQAQDDWNYFIEWIRQEAQDRWPSLDECDTWLDREDHAILENGHCWIGVSEYCGLASIWLVSKAEQHLNNWDHNLVNLATRWCDQIEPNFRKLFDEYQKLGTFSNGESVYQKKGDLAP